MYKVQGTEYYAGTDEELRDLAYERLTEDKSLWIEAIKANMTTDSLEDWANSVLDMDGWPPQLNSYDGTADEYDFTKYNIESVFVCQA